MSSKTIRIGNREVGDGCPVFFIAEAGVNHNGSTELAIELIQVAAEAGADAVKFQTFKAENLNTRKAPKATYHVDTTGKDEDQTWFELLKTQEIDREMHLALIEACADNDILFLSTPYDEESADLLDELGVAAFKLASTDTTNLPLIRHVAAKGVPLILSTAMCDMKEVEQAVTSARAAKQEDIVVLQCTGNYPADLKDSHVRVMPTFRERFNCLVGFSDHNEDFINPLVATALGACVYEKHFTLDKTLPGPDHRMALDPNELRETISLIRKAELSLGRPDKRALESEAENRLKLRKSLVLAVDACAGDLLTEGMIVMKRPGTGIPPFRLGEFLGRTFAQDIEADTVIVESFFTT